jgi:hypothetical protein
MINKKRWLELRDIDFSKYVKEKQSMSYISWGDMELLAHLHLTDEELAVPTSYSVADNIVTVTIGDNNYPLAISDFRNNAVENPDSTDICDTIQRATVKAFARHFGLAHKLYESSYYVSLPKASAKLSESKPSKQPINSNFF